MTPDIVSEELRQVYFDRLIDWIRNSDIDVGLVGALVNLCESEIEKRLLLELVFADWGYAQWHEVNIHDSTMPFPMHETVVTLAPQFQAGAYRIDIGVFVRGATGQVLKIAVECDGHDFHERTKEQAARDKKRDRELQKMGFLVFRFTGSEIYRQGRERAAEIAKHASDWITQTTKG